MGAQIISCFIFKSVVCTEIKSPRLASRKHDLHEFDTFLPDNKNVY